MACMGNSEKTLDREPVSITDNVKLTLVEDGELRKSLCIEKSMVNRSSASTFVCMKELVHLVLISIMKLTGDRQMHC